MTIVRNTSFIMQITDTSLVADKYDIVKETDGTMSLDGFINTLFPFFNLPVYLDTLDGVFEKMTDPDQLVKKITYNTDNNSLTVLVHDTGDKLRFKRRFYKENETIIVDHSFFRIPEAFRNKKLTKPVFREGLQQYVNMGLSIIRLYAGLESGGLVWAKFGFTATKEPEVRAIMEMARTELGGDSKEFGFVKKIYDKYYDGDFGKKQFPMILWSDMSFMEKILLGSNWHGELDLNNPEQYSNFEIKCS